MTERKKNVGRAASKITGGKLVKEKGAIKISDEGETEGKYPIFRQLYTQLNKKKKGRYV